jgi:hypothetical protein
MTKMRKTAKNAALLLPSTQLPFPDTQLHLPASLYRTMATMTMATTTVATVAMAVHTCKKPVPVMLHALPLWIALKLFTISSMIAMLPVNLHVRRKPQPLPQSRFSVAPSAVFATVVSSKSRSAFLLPAKICVRSASSISHARMPTIAIMLLSRQEVLADRTAWTSARLPQPKILRLPTCFQACQPAFWLTLPSARVT